MTLKLRLGEATQLEDKGSNVVKKHQKQQPHSLY